MARVTGVIRGTGMEVHADPLAEGPHPLVSSSPISSPRAVPDNWVGLVPTSRVHRTIASARLSTSCVSLFTRMAYCSPIIVWPNMRQAMGTNSASVTRRSGEPLMEKRVAQGEPVVGAKQVRYMSSFSELP